MPNKKSIKFTEKQLPKQDVIPLKFYYTKDEQAHLTNTLLGKYILILETCLVSIPKIKEEQYSLVINFYLDSSGVPHLDKANINEFYFEENIDKKEEKPDEKNKKERSTACQIKISECTFGLPQPLLDNLTQKEANLELEDKQHVYVVNKRNEIENFIYTTRIKLDSDLANFVSNEDKAVLLNLMAKAEEWFYSGDESIYNKAAIEANTKDLNELGSRIYKRFYEWNKLADVFPYFEKVLNNTQLSYQEKKVSLNPKQNQELTKIVTQYTNQLLEWKTQANSYPKVIDPPVTAEMVQKASEEMTFVRI